MINKVQSEILGIPYLTAVLPNAVVLEGTRIKTEVREMDIRLS